MVSTLEILVFPTSAKRGRRAQHHPKAKGGGSGKTQSNSILYLNNKHACNIKFIIDLILNCTTLFKFLQRFFQFDFISKTIYQEA